MLQTKRSLSLQAATVAAILAVPVLAYSFDLPGGDFQAGDPISAAQVNDKLGALLDAANELDETTAKLGGDADFGSVSVDTIEVANPTTKTLTYWADGAMVCQDSSCDTTETFCSHSINGRPGCIVSEMNAVTRVTIPLSAVPDGTLVEWGMHLGSSNGGPSNEWSCELSYNSNPVSTITFDVAVPGQWSRFENAANVDHTIDNHADGSGLGTGFASGWRVRCVSENAEGRLDFHQIYLRVQEA